MATWGRRICTRRLHRGSRSRFPDRSERGPLGIRQSLTETRHRHPLTEPFGFRKKRKETERRDRVDDAVRNLRLLACQGRGGVIDLVSGEPRKATGDGRWDAHITLNRR